MARFRTTDQRGFSIVELMVGVALSSAMVLAVTTLFVGNSQTLRVQNALLEVNDSGRYAVDRIARDVRMLGFRRDGYRVPSAIADSLVVVSGDSDVLTVVYEAPFDCNRVAVDASGLIRNEYKVVNGNLLCNDKVLARGVEELHVLLGEDLDGDRVPNRLVNPDATTLNMDRVVTVQIDALVRSDAGNVATGQQQFGTAWNTQGTADLHLRHEYSLTVALRNRI